MRLYPNISVYIEHSQRNDRNYSRVGIRMSCQFFFLYSQSFSVTSTWMFDSTVWEAYCESYPTHLALLARSARSTGSLEDVAKDVYIYKTRRSRLWTHKLTRRDTHLASLRWRSCEKSRQLWHNSVLICNSRQYDFTIS